MGLQMGRASERTSHSTHLPPLAKSKEAQAERPILGLPNVGKSTLFNTHTKLSVRVENFPFCTIEPNEARVNIPDERFGWLCQLFKPKCELKEISNSKPTVERSEPLPSTPLCINVSDNATVSHLNAGGSDSFLPVSSYNPSKLS
ncbi:GTP-binding protein [Forsythia ovata]|uniref:GTP-binding protein n=1 Tax=Forsythia ovata TaxID=205694 RepID=A0ABD1W9C4_9LAMI